MQIRYAIPAAMATVFRMRSTWSTVHGPSRGTGRSAGPPVTAATRAVLAAQIAAEIPVLSQRQAMLLASQGIPSIATQVAASNAVRGALAAQLCRTRSLARNRPIPSPARKLPPLRRNVRAELATQFPQLSAQQISLLIGAEIPAIATQIQASNTRGLLAAQLSQNPQLSPQQANVLASQEISAIATQVQSVASTRATLAAQLPRKIQGLLRNRPIHWPARNSRRKPKAQRRKAGVFPPGTVGVVASTPGLFPFGNGTIPPLTPVDQGGGDVDGVPQTAEGAALQGMAQVIRATGQYNQATAAGTLIGPRPKTTICGIRSKRCGPSTRSARRAGRNASWNAARCPPRRN